MTTKTEALEGLEQSLIRAKTIIDQAFAAATKVMRGDPLTVTALCAFEIVDPSKPARRDSISPLMAHSLLRVFDIRHRLTPADEAELERADASPGGQDEKSPGDKRSPGGAVTQMIRLRDFARSVGFLDDGEGAQLIGPNAVSDPKHVVDLIEAGVGRLNIKIREAEARAAEAELRAVHRETTEPKRDTVADRQLAQVRDLFVEDVSKGIYGRPSDVLVHDGKERCRSAADRIVETLRATGWRGQSWASLLQLRLDLHELKVPVQNGYDGAAKGAIAEIERLRSQVENLKTRNANQELTIKDLQGDVRRAELAHDTCKTTCDQLRDQISELQRSQPIPALPADFLDMVQGRVSLFVDEPSENRGAKAKQISEEVENLLRSLGARPEPIEVPLLPADFVETLAHHFGSIIDTRPMVDASEGQIRKIRCEKMAQAVMTHLRDLGAEAKPAFPATEFKIWTPDPDPPVLKIDAGYIRDFAQDIANAVSQASTLRAEEALFMVWPIVNHAVRIGRVTICPTPEIQARG